MILLAYVNKYIYAYIYLNINASLITQLSLHYSKATDDCSLRISIVTYKHLRLLLYRFGTVPSTQALDTKALAANANLATVLAAL